MSDHLRAHDTALERLRALHPKKIDLSLGRMRRLCAALGDPQRKLPPVVHVAGTNGKGSTVAFLRAITEAAGLRVHVFTSPHLVRFAERIRLAGTLIGDAHLAEVLDRVEAANAGEPITFFEITTAAAFLAFSEVEADLCLLEVGLGGALDATNVIEPPALSVVCPVDYDHREFLGDQLEGIAGEKAGIIKRGAPVVVARQPEAAMAVIEARALALGAPMQVMGMDFDAWSEAGRLLVQTGGRLLDLPPPSLAGRHQIDNAGLAAVAALTLKEARIDETAIAHGIASASWSARMQRLTAGPLGELARAAGADLWLDGGHNPHAGEAVARTLAELQAKDGRPVVLVVGMLANKDAEGFLRAFAGRKPKVIAVPFVAEAAAAPDDIAAAARAVRLQAETAPDLETATARAVSSAGPPHVLICGSLYLAGEVLAMSEETWPR
ncbi:MAG TPA: folylpolyglutamate synthase/dihydrofolate synthase family protein [Caulobacteraceae bacterium]|nr:folylpolyglutamate synthase/dihydrofolate synthase family protein [Caulobacteraceae bacterium]